MLCSRFFETREQADKKNLVPRHSERFMPRCQKRLYSVPLDKVFAYQRPTIFVSIAMTALDRFLPLGCHAQKFHAYGGHQTLSPEAWKLRRTTALIG